MAQTCGEQRKILNSPLTLVTLEYIKRKKMCLSYQLPFSTLQGPAAYLTTSVWRRKRVIGLNIRCR